MRLARVHPGDAPPSPNSRWTIQCCQCGARHPFWCLYADLDGDPFRAYYCEHCTDAFKQGDGEFRVLIQE